MFAVISTNCQLRKVDVRREDAGGPANVWVRTVEGTCIAFKLDDVPWLARALATAYEEAKAAPPDAVGVLFETERGEPAAAAAEAG